MISTTLNEIKDHHPCTSGWKQLLTYLNKSNADDEQLSYKTILNAIGIDDTVWCLRALEYKQYALFNADVAESVLHLFETKYPDDNRPRKAIEAIRLYIKGEITLEQFNVYVYAVSAATSLATANDAAFTASAAVYYASASAASASAASASAAAEAAVYTAVYGDDSAIKEQRDKIETIFIKHFCVETS